MVAVERDAFGGRPCFVLQPDIGFHWRQTSRIFLLIAATSLGVALVMVSLGYWPVLPFAGLEVGLLGWALHASASRGRERELILLRDDKIEVQKGRRGPERFWELDAYWTEVALLPGAYRWYPSLLLLRTRGKEIELGRFLHEDERVDLARELARRIGPMAASGEGA